MCYFSWKQSQAEIQEKTFNYQNEFGDWLFYLSVAADVNIGRVV